LGGDGEGRERGGEALVVDAVVGVDVVGLQPLFASLRCVAELAVLGRRGGLVLFRLLAVADGGLLTSTGKEQTGFKSLG
jgi:hypothetical protein